MIVIIVTYRLRMEPSCTPSTPLDPAVEIVQGVPAVQIVQGIPTVSDWETRIPCQVIVET